MNLIVLPSGESFPEPAFTHMHRSVFAGIQTYSEQFDRALETEAARGVVPPMPSQKGVETLRIGAYDGDALIGWTFGWFERGAVFYMASSGVIEAYRRQGVYSALVRTLCDHVGALGAVAVRSQHSVLNNSVIIAKLKLGFGVSGLSHSAQLGALVELTHYISQPRAEVLRERLLPFGRRESSEIAR